MPYKDEAASPTKKVRRSQGELPITRSDVCMVEDFKSGSLKLVNVQDILNLCMIISFDYLECHVLMDRRPPRRAILRCDFAPGTFSLNLQHCHLFYDPSLIRI